MLVAGKRGNFIISRREASGAADLGWRGVKHDKGEGGKGEKRNR